MEIKSITPLLLGTLLGTGTLRAQHAHEPHGGDNTRLVGAADATMAGPLSDHAMKHMLLTPTRVATARDSALARTVVAELRVALAKYADTSVALADGYRMFLPELKQQGGFHFTNHRNAFREAFRFDPS